MPATLPAIPAKRYFTIGEVSELCGVKPHVLRYWEQEFTQLRPMKRSGNRRYYQHHEVLMIRRIRDLLHQQGFTISGARVRLQELASEQRAAAAVGEVAPIACAQNDDSQGATRRPPLWRSDEATLRQELQNIRELLDDGVDPQPPTL